MIKASGQITANSAGTGMGARLVIDWQQEYTPGNGYSDIVVTAKIIRTNPTTGALGGTWYAQATGGVYVGGEKIGGWTKDQTVGAWGQPEAAGWTTSGTVRVNHTGSAEVEIKADQAGWYNTTYSNLSFTIPAKTETVTIEAEEKKGGAHIGGEVYSAYIGSEDGYKRYIPYVGAEDGSTWVPLA